MDINININGQLDQKNTTQKYLNIEVEQNYIDAGVSKLNSIDDENENSDSNATDAGTPPSWLLDGINNANPANFKIETKEA